MTIPNPVSIVTGANAGIGKEVAAGLLERGDTVILACRRRDACLEARADLLVRHPKSTCECLSLDLSDFTSIRTFSKAFQMQYGEHQLHLLVNNAGVMGPSSSSTTAPSLVDHQMAINHLGTFLLTRLLLPCMAPHGRIVTVGSEAHRRGRIDMATLAKPSCSSSDWWYSSYARSKLGNSLMTLHMAQELSRRNSTVTTTCVSPGRVYTDIFRNLHGVLGAAIKLLASSVFQNPKQGAHGVIKAVHVPELTDVLYVHKGREAQPSAQARDHRLAKNVWDWSCEQVGINEGEDAVLWPKC